MNIPLVDETMAVKGTADACAGRRPQRNHTDYLQAYCNVLKETPTTESGYLLWDQSTDLTEALAQLSQGKIPDLVGASEEIQSAISDVTALHRPTRGTDDYLKAYCTALKVFTGEGGYVRWGNIPTLESEASIHPYQAFYESPDDTGNDPSDFALWRW
ncbi:MAG: hypothetical protein F6K30_27675 [Cyanothece sp. SIO2G6]|nr:hypothetical protein [Cyanothece sp. SIO2G6]